MVYWYSFIFLSTIRWKSLKQNIHNNFKQLPAMQPSPVRAYACWFWTSS